MTLPDLRPTAFSASTNVVDAGTSLTVSWTVTNEGSVTASQPWTDYVYLSSDGTIGGDVTYTGLTHTQTLTASGSYDVVDHTFNIPNVPAGTYYLLLQVDGNNSVYEAEENDQVWPTAIQITIRTPDLRPTAFSASTDVVDAGTSLTVSWTATNEGTGQARQSWTDYVYLSTDAMIGGGVTYTGLTQTQNLAAGGSYGVVDHTFNIPNLPAGTYYLLLQVDGNNSVYEAEENDQVWSTAIQITIRTPDLRPTAFSVNDQTVSAGQMVSLSWTVTNEGTAQARQSWTDYVYFSSDTTIGGDVTYTGATHATNVAASASYDVVSHSFTIPNVPPGTYYLLLQVDGNNSVYEAEENDQVWPTPIVMTVQ